MENKEVYVYVEQEYADIHDVRVFDDKQKMLDYIYENAKNNVFKKLKKPVCDRRPYYETDEELHSFLNDIEKAYKDGSIGNSVTYKCKMNDNKLN